MTLHSLARALTRSKSASLYFRLRRHNQRTERMSENAQSPCGSEPGEAIAAAYRKHYDVLEYIAVGRFRVPEDDARGVIHDVFLAFIRNRDRIRGDERAWLVGAMFIQCRHYWRARGRDEVLCGLEEEIEPAAAAEDIATRVEVSNVLRQLSRRCRELLHLRFVEEYSSEEIARRLETTVDYARKLVHQCRGSARALFTRIRSRG